MKWYYLVVPLHLGIYDLICLNQKVLGVLFGFFTLYLSRVGVISDASEDFIEDLGESGEMDGNLVQIEPSPIENCKEVAWTHLREGRLVSFMQCIEGYDETIPMCFVNLGNNMRVVMNGISFEINKEVINKVGGFSLEGRKWRKTTSVADEVNLIQFF